MNIDKARLIVEALQAGCKLDDNKPQTIDKKQIDALLYFLGEEQIKCDICGKESQISLCVNAGFGSDYDTCSINPVINLCDECFEDETGHIISIFNRKQTERHGKKVKG